MSPIAEAKGIENLNLSWLLDHHIAKEQHRQRLVDSLALRPNDHILDLGCGPGLWSTLFAEKIAPDGLVVGVDLDTELIDYAEHSRQKNPFQANIRYQLADFMEMGIEDETFDLVFASGFSPYFEDVMPIIEEQKRITKKGGRIADRTWDDGMLVIYPINPYLLSKVMTGVAKSFEERAGDGYFDNYFGRKSYGLFRQAGLSDIVTQTYAVQILAPLSTEERSYIQGNVEWFGTTAKPYLSEEEYQTWQAHFDPNSDQYIFDRDDFYFCMMEVLTIGTVHHRT